MPFAFAVTFKEQDQTQELREQIQKEVRDKVGAFAKLEKVVFVQKLPKTRSGKVLRNLLRDLSNAAERPRITATIEDPSVVR